MEKNKEENFEEEQYPSEIIEYIMSEPGHEIIKRIITLIEDIKKSTLDKNVELTKINVTNNHKQRAYLIIQQTIVFVVIVIASIYLAVMDKFSPTIGVLFGTVIGYFFGKKTLS
ncbi:hypothetical protein [Leptospira kanakyensis]|uniref:hypothetical protein n=1 Tax=Leptospira kanakyensis TaxID=2484968 RepID=UPI00223DB6B2|nr:hypothetical protein [Leptospira kanakyensis]MCW7471852.1 hypothetical protein [Leptospira kanakyensis]